MTHTGAQDTRVLTAKGAATRQRIVEGAAEVIRDIGAADATLDRIRGRTATSKSQLFHYFPEGRSQLLLAVANFEADRVLADQQPHLGNLDSWQAWQRWRDAVIERYRRQGRSCPVAVLASELGRTDAAAQEVTRSLFLRWRTELATGVRAMQANGHVRVDLDADMFAGALVAAVQGGVSILLATGQITDLESAMDLMLCHLRPGPIN